MHHILLPALNASTWTGPTGTNTYLLPGRMPTLIDAGVGKPEHIEAIARELQGAPLALVLITHGHSDHAAGYLPLSARWPDVRIRQFGSGDQPIEDEEVIERWRRRADSAPHARPFARSLLFPRRPGSRTAAISFRPVRRS